MSCADIFLAFIAILFPPIAVWIKCGLCTADSFINIALCCLGYLPGLIHAWYIIARNPDPMDEYEPIRDSERQDGQVTYYYISQDQQAQRGYGSQGPARKTQDTARKTQDTARPAPNPPSQGAGSSSAAGGEEQAPPSYNDAVRGDHKVQTQE